MLNFKLVVVSPFNGYRRGDQILDSEIIENFLDKNHKLNIHLINCRRVVKNIDEMKFNNHPEPVVPIVDNSPNLQTPDPSELNKIEVESTFMKIESIKADENETQD